MHRVVIYFSMHLSLPSLVASQAGAGPYGLAQKPPMGWRSWNSLGPDVTQTKMEAIADIMSRRSRLVAGHKTSLADLGYIHIGLDDNWQACGKGVHGSFYSEDGDPLVNLATFPNMKGMVDHAHERGLKAGWYLNNCICGIGPGTFQPGEEEDKVYSGSVKALVEYGFDGVKIDSCSQFMNMTKWSALLAATGREVLVENCHNSDAQDPCFEAKACPEAAACPYNFWRTSTDINPSWDSIYSNLQTTKPWSHSSAGPLSRPGRWAYPDMLEVGNMPSFVEDRTHFGMWIVTSSPLILGLDLTDDSRVDRIWEVISNTEAIAINQHWYGHPGSLLKNGPQHAQQPDYQIWGKQLDVSKWAVLVFNGAPLSGSNISIQISFALLGGDDNTIAKVRCIWQQKDLGQHVGHLSTDTLAPHDSQFFLIELEHSAARDQKRMQAELKYTPTTCESQCIHFGHCCMGDTCPDQHPSCAMGCSMGRESSSLGECETMCKEADNHCSFTLPKSGHVIQMCGECSNTTCPFPAGWSNDRSTSLEQCFQGCIFMFGCSALPPAPKFDTRDIQV